MRRSLLALLVACAPVPPDVDGVSTTDDTGTTGTTGEPTSTDPGTAAPTTGIETPPVVCGDGDVTLTTQAQVQALAGCTDLPGALTIRGEVGDLTPLTSLRHVAGALIIDGQDHFYPPVPISLTGLESLESVGALVVQNSPVTSLEPLSGLTDIPGSLTLASLPDLPSLEGLHNITHVGDTLEILAGNHLDDFTGLRGLQRVDGDLDLNTLGITSLHGLEALTQVGLPGEITGVSLALPNLTSLAELSIAWHAGHAFYLYDTRVSDLAIFTGVTRLHAMRLISNDDLTDLAGLESLTLVTDTLELSDNKSLTDITALGSLESVGALTLGPFQPFSDLGPLTALTTIGTLEATLTRLVDLGPLPALQQLGPVKLRDNGELISLSALAGRPTLDALNISYNHALVALPDLAALTDVQGDLEIRRNNALTAVADLSSLAAVGGRLIVVGNPELPQQDAEAWAAPLSVVGGLKIAANKDAGPPVDPCPWQEDGECDEAQGGLEICVDDSDEIDCTNPMD